MKGSRELVAKEDMGVKSFLKAILRPFFMLMRTSQPVERETA